MNNKLIEIQQLCFRMGQEIGETGELSPISKTVLHSISIFDIRQHREEFQQETFKQIRQWVRTPVQQELVDALVNCSKVFANETTDQFIKDCLDILRLEKGNTLINKLLARCSDYIDSYVVVEDTSELDENTYQQLRSGFKQIIGYVQSQMWMWKKRFNKMDEEKGKAILRSLKVEDFRKVREMLRKFVLKALDTESEIYTQIPAVWRAEVKHLLKSTVNLLAGVLDENLIYDCLKIGLDVADNKITEQEAQNRLIKRVAQQLNQWARQGHFYVKKAPSTSFKEDKFFNLVQSVPQLNQVDNQQVQQLQAEINQLRQEIQDLRTERERERAINQ